MRDLQKQEIVKAILNEKESLGSLRAIAIKCKASEATISQMINGNWEKISDKMWRTVGAGIDWKAEGWQLVETTNMRLLLGTFQDAKAKSLFVPVSHRAGSGKTATSKSFAAANKANGVFYIQCREWAAKKFLQKLCQALGVDPGRGYLTSDDIIESIIDFFQQRSHLKPLLIIDEADKLKPAALRALIPLYNECEGGTGVVILGTENLEKEIKKGVRMNKKGFDEIDSRFGRNFVHLIGATKKDVQSICIANGIEDKAVAKRIFDEAEPINIVRANQQFKVVADLRRIKRAVERELLKAS